MSGPLEELRAAWAVLTTTGPESAGIDWTKAQRDLFDAVAALLAASGTGERPADGKGRLRFEFQDDGACEATVTPAATGGRERCDQRVSLGGAGSMTCGEFLPCPFHPTPPDAGTGEPPATAKAWLHSDPGRCNHVETGHMGRVPSCKNPQGEWIPLVPDAGTGTPSDDRRVGWILEALASRYSMTARTGPWSEGFRDGLSAAMQYARRATPAAPSGTTGATTGDES